MIIEGEECKFIEGTDEFYAVSVTGKVWSFRTNSNQHKVNKKSDYPREKGTSLNKNGYYLVKLTINGRRKHYYVHRLVAEAFIPNPLKLRDVNHKNEIKTDNRVENLEWLSHKDNINYGTHNVRVKNSNTKIYICPEKLKSLRQSGMYIRDMAKEFNVSYKSVWNRLKELGIK